MGNNNGRDAGVGGTKVQQSHSFKHSSQHEVAPDLKAHHSFAAKEEHRYRRHRPSFNGGFDRFFIYRVM